MQFAHYDFSLRWESIVPREPFFRLRRNDRPYLEDPGEFAELHYTRSVQSAFISSAFDQLRKTGRGGPVKKRTFECKKAVSLGNALHPMDEKDMSRSPGYQ